MTTERAQKIWEAFCGELIDNGVKDGEDVKQALSTSIREVVNLYNDWVDDTWDMMNVVHVKDMLDIADELEEME